jgi:hypothetical protein
MQVTGLFNQSLILYDANVAGELEKTEEFGTEILKLSVHWQL